MFDQSLAAERVHGIDLQATVHGSNPGAERNQLQATAEPARTRVSLLLRSYGSDRVRRFSVEVKPNVRR
jgi:hypothetical protein